MKINGYEVRKSAAGRYEIDRNDGTHTIARLVVTRNMEGFEHKRPGTYWMHVPGGEFAPSDDFRTLTDAVAYVHEHFPSPQERPVRVRMGFSPAALRSMSDKAARDRAEYRATCAAREADERLRFG